MSHLFSYVEFLTFDRFQILSICLFMKSKFCLAIGGNINLIIPEFIKINL